jgi:hypothetical protein
VIPDARELHRVITACASYWRPPGSRGRPARWTPPSWSASSSAPPRPSSTAATPLTEARRGELLPHIVRVILPAFLELVQVHQAGRDPGARRCPVEERVIVSLGQEDPDGQSLGRCHHADAPVVSR